MKLLWGTLLLILILLPAASITAASGCSDGTSGDDHLACSENPPADGNDNAQFDGDLGHDVMVVEAGIMVVNLDGDGGVMGDLRGMGDGGDDILTNYGTVTASIGGDWVSGNGGDDTIYNYGQVNINIMGDQVLGAGGDDTILNAATVENAIHGEGGDDTIILTDGANGGADHVLLLNGGAGTDVLIFRFSDPAVRDQIKAGLDGQSPADGSLTINDQTFTWTNFEGLRAEAAGEATAKR
jgi:hypothetical protein